jgi:hypothetical protein
MSMAAFTLSDVNTFCERHKKEVDGSRARLNTSWRSVAVIDVLGQLIEDKKTAQEDRQKYINMLADIVALKVFKPVQGAFLEGKDLDSVKEALKKMGRAVGKGSQAKGGESLYYRQYFQTQGYLLPGQGKAALINHLSIADQYLDEATGETPNGQYFVMFDDLRDKKENLYKKNEGWTWQRLLRFGNHHDFHILLEKFEKDAQADKRREALKEFSKQLSGQSAAAFREEKGFWVLNEILKSDRLSGRALSRPLWSQEDDENYENDRKWKDFLSKFQGLSNFSSELKEFEYRYKSLYLQFGGHADFESSLRKFLDFIKGAADHRKKSALRDLANKIKEFGVGQDDNWLLFNELLRCDDLDVLLRAKILALTGHEENKIVSDAEKKELLGKVQGETSKEGKKGIFQSFFAKFEKKKSDETIEWLLKAIPHEVLRGKAQESVNKFSESTDKEAVAQKWYLLSRLCFEGDVDTSKAKRDEIIQAITNDSDLLSSDIQIIEKTVAVYTSSFDVKSVLYSLSRLNRITKSKEEEIKRTLTRIKAYQEEVERVNTLLKENVDTLQQTGIPRTNLESLKEELEDIEFYKERLGSIKIYLKAKLNDLEKKQGEGEFWKQASEDIAQNKEKLKAIEAHVKKEIIKFNQEELSAQENLESQKKELIQLTQELQTEATELARMEASFLAEKEESITLEGKLKEQKNKVTTLKQTLNDKEYASRMLGESLKYSKNRKKEMTTLEQNLQTWKVEFAALEQVLPTEKEKLEKRTERIAKYLQTWEEESSRGHNTLSKMILDSIREISSVKDLDEKAKLAKASKEKSIKIIAVLEKFLSPGADPEISINAYKDILNTEDSKRENVAKAWAVLSEYRPASYNTDEQFVAIMAKSIFDASVHEKENVAKVWRQITESKDISSGLLARVGQMVSEKNIRGDADVLLTKLSRTKNKHKFLQDVLDDFEKGADKDVKKSIAAADEKCTQEGQEILDAMTEYTDQKVKDAAREDFEKAKTGEEKLEVARAWRSLVGAKKKKDEITELKRQLQEKLKESKGKQEHEQITETFERLVNTKKEIVGVKEGEGVTAAIIDAMIKDVKASKTNEAIKEGVAGLWKRAIELRKTGHLKSIAEMICLYPEVRDKEKILSLWERLSDIYDKDLRAKYMSQFSALFSSEKGIYKLESAAQKMFDIYSRLSYIGYDSKTETGKLIRDYAERDMGDSSISAMEKNSLAESWKRIVRVELDNPSISKIFVQKMIHDFASRASSLEESEVLRTWFQIIGLQNTIGAENLEEVADMVGRYKAEKAFQSFYAGFKESLEHKSGRERTLLALQVLSKMKEGIPEAVKDLGQKSKSIPKSMDLVSHAVGKLETSLEQEISTYSWREFNKDVSEKVKINFLKDLKEADPLVKPEIAEVWKNIIRLNSKIEPHLQSIMEMILSKKSVSDKKTVLKSWEMLSEIEDEGIRNAKFNELLKLARELDESSEKYAEDLYRKRYFVFHHSFTAAPQAEKMILEEKSAKLQKLVEFSTDALLPSLIRKIESLSKGKINLFEKEILELTKEISDPVKKEMSELATKLDLNGIEQNFIRASAIDKEKQRLSIETAPDKKRMLKRTGKRMDELREKIVKIRNVLSTEENKEVQSFLTDIDRIRRQILELSTETDPIGRALKLVEDVKLINEKIQRLITETNSTETKPTEKTVKNLKKITRMLTKEILDIDPTEKVRDFGSSIEKTKEEEIIKLSEKTDLIKEEIQELIKEIDLVTNKGNLSSTEKTDRAKKILTLKEKIDLVGRKMLKLSEETGLISRKIQEFEDEISSDSRKIQKFRDEINLATKRFKNKFTNYRLEKIGSYIAKLHDLNTCFGQIQGSLWSLTNCLGSQGYFFKLRENLQKITRLEDKAAMWRKIAAVSDSDIFKEDVERVMTDILKSDKDKLNQTTIPSAIDNMFRIYQYSGIFKGQDSETIKFVKGSIEKTPYGLEKAIDTWDAFLNISFPKGDLKEIAIQDLGSTITNSSEGKARVQIWKDVAELINGQEVKATEQDAFVRIIRFHHDIESRQKILETWKLLKDCSTPEDKKDKLLEIWQSNSGLSEKMTKTSEMKTALERELAEIADAKKKAEKEVGAP